ncbi:MAG: nucleotidyltransferase domain-containing protein [Flammeovirgaceae bacterium]|jgi:predicted nucleotidyltransferase|nr:nucleotidyltransferase domain-containing protein [Flammeovirgaceae bacterium]
MFTIRIAKQIVRKLIEDLRENGFDPTRAILFGSVAKGKAHPLSDIDVAIWDEKFTGCRPIDIEAIVKILHSYPRVEVHTYSAKEKGEDNPFIKEIEKRGIEISLAANEHRLIKIPC